MAPGIGEEITITTWLLNHLRYLGSSSTQTRWALKCLTHRFHVWCIYGCALPSQGYLAIFPMIPKATAHLVILALQVPSEDEPEVNGAEVVRKASRIFPSGSVGCCKKVVKIR